MMALAKDRVVACCSSRKAFTGHAEAATQCVASGALGKVRLVRIRAVQAAGANPREHPPPWRQSMKLNGGGILVNWSCYELDYLMQILGWSVKPKAVLANWWPVADKMSAYAAPDSDADSHYAAFIQCEDDVVLSMERAEFSSTITDQAWAIVGTDASLHLPMNPAKGEPNVVTLDKFVPGEGVVSETLWEEAQGDPDNDVIQDFVGAIRNGTEPKTNLERALMMQKITDAIYASAESGGCVAIS
jgi:predicted dehydrogenase